MYSELFDLHAELLKALAHPRRLEIIHLLREQELCVSDIYEMLDLPQANISQHLMILREAGVVKTHRVGKQVLYQLASQKIIQVSDILRGLLIEQHPELDLAQHLTLKMSELVPLVHDPVCQMRVSPRTASGSAHYAGHDYYFCASGCLKKFQATPEKYAQS